MPGTALIIVESDPRQSGRPAEAIRIAAGVSVWKKVQVSVCLRDAAVLVLGEEVDDFVNGNNIGEHLGLLRESGASIFVQKSAAVNTPVGTALSVYEDMGEELLAELAASSECVLRF